MGLWRLCHYTWRMGLCTWGCSVCACKACRAHRACDAVLDESPTPSLSTQMRFLSTCLWAVVDGWGQSPSLSLLRTAASSLVFYAFRRPSANTCICTHVSTHTHTHTARTHARTHIHTHTHARTHARTHTPPPPPHERARACARHQRIDG